MPSTTEKLETSKEAKLKGNKRGSKNRTPNNNIPELSPQENHNNNNSKNSAEKRQKYLSSLLASDLSPKYIGFNTAIEGKRRIRRQNKTNNTNPLSSTSPSNIIENAGVLTNSVSYVKMTPVNIKKEILSPSSSSTSINEKCSPVFESPIEKLIKKNKELGSLTSSPSNVHHDNFYSKNETPRKNALLNHERKLNNSTNIVEHEKLISINNDYNISASPNSKHFSKTSIRKNKLKSKLKNFIKLVPLESVSNDSIKHKNHIESDISSQEREMRNLKNTPQKIRSPQVLLHKSPQIERMHNEQMKNKKNSRIFKNVQILSEMTTIKNIEVNNKSKTNEKVNLLPNFSNIEVQNTEINKANELDLENVLKTYNIANKHQTESNTESLTVNEKSNGNSKESLNVSNSENQVSEEIEFNSLQFTNNINTENDSCNGENEFASIDTESKMIKNSESVIDKEQAKTLLENEISPRIKTEVTTKIVTTTVLDEPVEKTDNIKNTEPNTENFEDISETDLRTENLPLIESPTKNILIEFRKNRTDEIKEVEKLSETIKTPNNDILNPNEPPSINKFNMKLKSHKKSINLNKNNEIIKFSLETVQSDDKSSTNNKILDLKKFTETELHEIENSELALENILYENDVLGNVPNIDDDFEIMNISSDFDDLTNSATLELDIPNLNVQRKIEKIVANNDNETLFVNKNNNLSIDDKINPNIVETVPNAVPFQETIPSNEIISNDNKNDSESIVTSAAEISDLTDILFNESKSQIKETKTFQENFKKEEKKQLNNLENLPSSSKTTTAPDNDSFAYTLMSNARSTKSPSSTDSAKGSSIDIETNFQPKFGEIFWARISKYPFWPCIVWPDPDGKTISIGKNGSRQHIRIHVKFFADNGRRSWIRKEDLMAYNGREDFERKKKQFWEQNNVNKKNLLARAFLINESKKPLWNQAVIEASLVLNEHIEKRSEKFEKILEETRELQFFERRKKRLSLHERRSSISSIAGSEDILNNNIGNAYAIGRKRDRSPTPESPPFEGVDDFKTFFKKRKISLSTTNNSLTELNKTSSLIQLNERSNSNLNLFESDEIDFNRFTELMTTFVQPEKDEEHNLFINLKEIWEIKLRSEATKNFNLTNQNNNNSLDGEQNFKRFSKRVTTLLFRRSLPAQKRPFATKQKLDKPKRERLPGVPIVKVVEDIFELNKNYLFNGLKREPVCKVCLKPGNLYKCSENCQSWIHENCADLPEAITVPSQKHKDKKQIQNNNNINNNVLVNNTNNTECLPMHVTGEEILLKEMDTNELNINEHEEILNFAIPQDVENIRQPIEITCKECKEKLPSICYVCKKNINSNDDETPIKCNINNCGKYFHISCLKYWPQARLTKSKTKIERFICPSHTCQTCVSDDPKGKFLKLQCCTKCILCPASYHIDSTCIPAGSKIITATELICPRHRQNKQILNTNWCFICSDGGNLVCCESCPTSFHLECLNIDKLPEAGYICEECETGRLPLYGELIWAKFGVHKWWPCITIPPPQIPKNLYRVKHNDFDFCVRFFGTNDHSWISRDRVFLYQEDDWRYSSKVKTNDKDFIKALEEANLISELLKAKKIMSRKNNDKKMLLVPTPYKKINVNRPVPPVKLQEIDVSDELNPCNCDPNNDKPCDLFSGCLNRLLMIECHPKICPAGNKCNNQMFEKRLYAAVKVIRTSGKGFGLVSDELITAGTFIIEYVGELIDDNELKRRIAQKQEEKDENYYFLTMQHGLVIDAGPKGNMARFMNHSCEPNCETQKWNVNGNTRIGLFAINDIPPDTEITFNYNLECIGDDRKPCHCGAEKCAGFIGAKYKKIDKKIEINSEKAKAKVGKRNRPSTSSSSNFQVPNATTIPKNS